MRKKCFALSCTALTVSLFVAIAGAQSITQVGQFTAGDLNYWWHFGAAAALAGDTVVVSAPSTPDQAGAMYVYEKPSTGWGTVAPTAELDYDCNTGGRVAISADGSTIAALAEQCYGGQGAGSTRISIWVRPEGGWQHSGGPTAVIVNQNNQPFGSSCGNNFALSSDGKTLVCSDNLSWVHKNYLYFFDRPSTGWVSTTKPNLTVTLNSGVKQFVTQIAMSGEIVALSSDNAQRVLVFQRTSSGLTQRASLSTSDGAHFGGELVMDSQTIVIEGTDLGSGTEKVYVFSKPSSGWQTATETAQITAAGSSTAGIGQSIAKSGNVLVVGGSSAAYVYVEPAGGWQTTSQPNATLLSTDPYQVDFGGMVAIQDTTIVVGDPGEGQGGNQNGAAYIFVAQ